MYKFKIIENITITINNVSIKQVHSARFMGVYIDNKMIWKDHISYISNKLAKSISMLHGVKWTLIHELSANYIILLYYHTFHTVQ